METAWIRFAFFECVIESGWKAPLSQQKTRYRCISSSPLLRTAAPAGTVLRILENPPLKEDRLSIFLAWNHFAQVRMNAVGR